ncbi:methylenetetrahydrofolate reductase (NAD(P)H) MET13 Ecym_3063 [Eremothecium cymbalariae DBVPG|uniref:MTHFR SAM-binding regulatory domain-containing protein n=1 Tax=Eremothecium cymbalariae (strain CBS 270.75 / DBVPG 7215 / KCTC 17166 / NRRL Y-17582) TaxID=931890 RepID=G8JR06_ERECY|nr:Hypothetical protein Ecym_3063 [Eremothecium cymbalariae DBVPG\
MRISQKLQQLCEQQQTDENGVRRPSFSFEFFVPKTAQGVQNLYDLMDKMYQSQPEFINITWNAGGRKSQLTTELVSTSQSVLGLETCMHLTCTNMPCELIDEALKQAYESGCQNILALRGDPPIVGDTWAPCERGFRYAKDLVLYIREKYGDHFDIGVAGHPEGYEEDEDPQQVLRNLKEKVDAGANFIVTQMFYDVDNFIDWCRKVREVGINVPIIPGIMPITSYSSFLRRAKWCQIHIPQMFYEKLEPVKDNDQAVREIGTKIMADICQKLLDSGYVTHLHMYTMNLEHASLMILDRLGVLPFEYGAEKSARRGSIEALPWRKSLNPNRRNESVRPIFWQRRPYSYVARTAMWSADEFPNGRFGDSSSPAYGDLDLCGRTLLRQTYERSLILWGQPKTLQDLAHLLITYLKGNIKCLPWSDVPLSREVDEILDSLLTLNSNLIFTINSQPKVNGVPSTHLLFGWGPADGYVYQKQYLEFLLPKNKLEAFHQDINANYPTLTYFSVDVHDMLATNHPDESKANAVTWGVFAGREVLQPTVVEKSSFLAWKEEFYRILLDWKLSFQENNALESAELLQTVIEDYALINIVDNDFVTKEDRIYQLLSKLF